MSRAAARAGFEEFLDATVTATREEFSVQRALQGTGLGPGGLVLDRLRENTETLERRIVEPELATYRDRALAQFDIVLDYVDSDQPIDAFEDDLLAHDGYRPAIKDDVPPNRYRQIIDELVDRNRQLGDGIEPIVSRPEDEFWTAVDAAFDRSNAIDLVEQTFPFTGPVRRHRSAFAFEIRIDPSDVVGGVLGAGLPSVTIDYTDEVLRATRQAERRIIDETTDEIADRIDDESGSGQQPSE